MRDVYLSCCSIEMPTDVCQWRGLSHNSQRSFEVVRHVLAETLTCGMYNQAGRFAVEVGKPAKSGVSGALMVIVPNLFGFATFSP